jgi:L-2-hydroxycarboxylate dehydrogenase (NAD+)
VKVAITELKHLVRRVIQGLGYDEPETEIIVDVLLYAQLRGTNQGIVKLIGQGMSKDPIAGEIELARETKLSALLNGNRNAGMVVMKRAMELAIQRTRNNGFGIVGTYNTSTSTGAIGYYARKVAEEGFIGLVFAGSSPTVCTYGSYEPIFGTNPIAVGIPNLGDPIVLDMATSAMAWYGLVEAKAAAKQIPHNVAYDKNGQLTKDPAQALEGALLPFDQSYKGAGLALIVEVLTGPLVAASFANLGDSRNWGNLVIVFDPELLVDKDLFKKQVSDLIRQVSNCKRVPGITEIYVPGQRGDNVAQEAIRAGEIEIEDNLYAELQREAESIG